MAVGPETLSTLPSDFGAQPIDQALKTLLRAVLGDRAAYFELSRRHAELARWIEED